MEIAVSPGPYKTYIVPEAHLDRHEFNGRTLTVAYLR